MHSILTPEQMRRADAAMTADFGIPPLLLMENAARSAAELILGLWRDRELDYPLVHVFCGAGNNGGDGFAIARHLYDHCSLRIFCTGDPARMSEETRTNRAIAERLGIPVEYLADDEAVARAGIDCDCAIDALIGVGGSEHPRGTVLALLRRLRDIEAMTIAVDIPTGMNAATGACHDDCFRAEYTITMEVPKTGLYLGDAPDYCGDILPAPFGVPNDVVAALNPVWVLSDDDIRAVLPRRKRRSSKHDYGTVMIVGGALHMPGAPVLATHAALGIGAGRVRLFAPSIHAGIRPEIMTKELPATDAGTIAPGALDTLVEFAAQAQAVVFGPGLGSDERTVAMGREFIDRVSQRIPIVVDADGLLCIDRDRTYNPNVILTPHHGEFARLIGADHSAVRDTAQVLAVEWAQRLNCTLLVKNVPTVVTDGETTFWNLTGNPGMATAGSGDVLAGFIGGLAGQQVEPLFAAALGAYLHARAGDEYVREYAEETLKAGMLIEYLGRVLAGVSS